jgi:hypothetical protein
LPERSGPDSSHAAHQFQAPTGPPGSPQTPPVRRQEPR